LNCSQSPECYCSLFYNYSRLISDILFNNDYYRFIDQRIKHSNRTYIYQYSYHTAQEHPTSCNDYLHKRDLVGHFAELEYTWGTPILSEKVNLSHNITPLIRYVRYEFNRTIDSNLTQDYTDEQIQFSKQLIQHWSNFIKYGRPKSSIFKYKWPPVSNISTASIMHLQANRSEIKQLTIPSGVLFWKSECPITKDNLTIIAQIVNQGTVLKLSLTIFFCSLLFDKVLSLINSFQ
jgi:carboxylesterase type B